LENAVILTSGFQLFSVRYLLLSFITKSTERN